MCIRDRVIGWLLDGKMRVSGRKVLFSK
jgi:hypothetical protein